LTKDSRPFLSPAPLAPQPAAIATAMVNVDEATSAQLAVRLEAWKYHCFGHVEDGESGVASPADPRHPRHPRHPREPQLLVNRPRSAHEWPNPPYAVGRSAVGQTHICVGSRLGARVGGSGRGLGSGARVGGSGQVERDSSGSGAKAETSKGIGKDAGCIGVINPAERPADPMRGIDARYRCEGRKNRLR
jgi:hypothetical protein